ncbi:MAG TPA: serine/threonine-protein kinase [Acidimicrobiales bacterium]|nr:serine/threonine-protein kinase [Acidimicrobiales bacterium]
MAELIGARYRLGEHLGQGGMGQVWEAEDMVLRRRVAIKAVDLPPHLSSEDREGLRTRVLREARTAARIDHRSSVQVFDVLEDGDRIHVVMELVAAPTLESLVARDGPLEPDRAAGLGLGLLGALDAAHAAGIVHRDVKPANVMMLEDGGVKLADFGIASAKDDTRITAAGLVLGTPSYMAPEQAEGRTAGPPADLWSLGALLYYAVEGVAPFERGEALPTLNAVLHDPPRPMERADGLAPAVTALLAKAPEERATAAQTRRALERVARPPQAMAAPAAAASGPTVVMPAAAPDQRNRHAAAAPTTAPSRRPAMAGNRAWLVGLATAALVAAVALVLVLNLGGTDTAGSSEDAAPPVTDQAAPAPTEPPAGSTDEPVPTTADSDPVPTAAPEADRPAGVPGNWEPYVDDQVGYSIWHPPSWEPRRGPAASTDFVDSATGDYLRVDSVNKPGDDPVAAWEASSQSFASRYDDYEELRIEPTSYQGYDAALWEYTYKGLHATNLGIVTPNRGYALNFQTAEGRWDDRQTIRDAFESAFRIGGGEGGDGDD